MKKIYITLAMLLGFAVMTAQPTISTDIMFEIGDSGPVQNFSQGMGVFDPGPAGADVTWDFSNVTNTGLPFSWTAEDPANTPWADSFPDATLAFDFPLDSIRDVRYYKFDGNKLDLLGTVIDIDGSVSRDTFFYNLNPNPQLEIQFPLTYNDQFTDVSTGTARVGVMGMTFVVDRTINRSFSADGYGTLTTPFATFQNVLRLKVDETITDKLFGQTVTSQQNTRYFWYVPNEKYLAMQMETIIVSPTGGPSTTSYNMFYRNGAISTGLEKNLADEMGMKTYPNPAVGTLNVAFDLAATGQVEIDLVSLTGQVLHTITAGILSQGSHRTQIHTEGIASGLYLLRVKTPTGAGTRMVNIIR